MSDRSPRRSSLGTWAAATRAAGATVALGYLLGVAQGPIAAAAGGLGLITFGRALRAGRTEAVFLGSALAILAAALGITALRWGALDLDGIRGVQAFFGPTLLVGPVAAATASWLAAAAGLVALGLWLDTPAGSLPAAMLWVGEAALGGFAIVTAFWGEAIVGWGGGTGSVWPGVSEWAAAIASATGASLLVAIAGRRVGTRTRWVALGVAGAIVVTSALVTASAVPGVV